MPAFEALLAPGRATAALLHSPQLPAPSIPPDLALWLPIPIPALQLGPKMPPSAKKAAGRGKETSRDGEPRESPRGEHCPHCTAALEGSRSPGTVKQLVWVPNVTEELSFLQPNHVGCGLGFLRQSLASSLAAPELVCLVGLVWGTALSPVSPPSVGRGAGGRHQAPEQSRLLSAASPLACEASHRARASFDVLLAQLRAPSGALFSSALRHPLTRSRQLRAGRGCLAVPRRHPASWQPLRLLRDTPQSRRKPSQSTRTGPRSRRAPKEKDSSPCIGLLPLPWLQAVAFWWPCKPGGTVTPSQEDRGGSWLPVLTAVLAPPSARRRAPRASVLAQHLAPGTDASRLLPKSRLGDAGCCSAGFESLIPHICMGRIWGKTQL